MKKTLLFAIMAGAALAGCVKNEEVAMSSGSSPERIKFDAPVVSVPTRATEIYGNYPNDKDFAVYALYHVGDFTSFDATGTSLYMTNVKCEANKKGENETPDYWAPVTTYYWPKGDKKLTFAAYAPAKESGVAWSESGFTFTGFEVEDNPDNQIDLLYSDRVYDQTSSNMHGTANLAPYQGIAIPFKHALSSIIFKIKTEGNFIVNKVNEQGETVVDDDKSTFIRLYSLTVKNVIKKGDFAQNLKADKSGDDDTDKPAWIPATATEATRKDYPVYTAPKINKNDVMVYDWQNAKNLTETEKFVNEEDEDDETYGNPTTDDYGVLPTDPSAKNNGTRKSDLILIPQSLDRGTGANDDVIFTIEYAIKTGKEEPVLYTHEYKMKAGTGVSAPTSWEMGKRYVYTITIGLETIKFTPQVYNWVDVPSDYIEIK